jgi:hypothetical protein
MTELRHAASDLGRLTWDIKFALLICLALLLLATLATATGVAITYLILTGSLM